MTIVGIDIGGTFTDLVGFQDGKVFSSKSLTTPSAPTEGVADCMSLSNLAPPTVSDLIHGSTIAINTVLELKGAPAALVVTKGFRDVYSIGRSNRPENFNIFFHRPKPLIPRTLTFEVTERMTARGDVRTPLDRDELVALCAELRTRDLAAVAICFLHAYANPEHEREAKEIMGRELPGIFITPSHEILREFREYERTSTTALNAYVGPRVHTYLGQLRDYLQAQDFAGKVQIMRSNGGTMTVRQARTQPVGMMKSGPVAGVIGVAALAKLLDIKQCIAFDMGGTTAKASLIQSGDPVVRDGYFIGGHVTGQPMQLPVVDIVEVGAGGGSIAWCDGLKGLHVGPQSAGAEPGPACYCKGGAEPTVTDANLVLGRLSPGRFLGGRMGLDVAAARKAIGARVADPLGLSIEAAAQGIARIVSTTMSLSIRSVSVDRGFDPRECTMFAFGGGGPLHASALAREIFIPRVIVPKFPGTFSALGMLLAAWRQDYVRTLIADLDDIAQGAVLEVLKSLEDEGLQQLSEDRLDPRLVLRGYGIDMRYRGQEHHIGISLPPGLEAFEPDDRRRIADLFHAQHERHFSHSSPGEKIRDRQSAADHDVAAGCGFVEPDPFRSLRVGRRASGRAPRGHFRGRRRAARGAGSLASKPQAGRYYRGPGSDRGANLKHAAVSGRPRHHQRSRPHRGRYSTADVLREYADVP